MPLSIIIDAPITKVFEVLDDPTKNDKWNPVTKNVIPNKDNPKECFVESFMGNFTTKKDTDGSTRVTITIVGNPVLKELSYNLEKFETNKTKVNGTIKFAGTEHYGEMHQTVGNALLEGLKKYVEQL